MRKIRRADLAAGQHQLRSELLEHAAVQRPSTRGECRGGQRPCPWVACKHHFYLDINPATGSIKINFPDLEPWELQHTCALDIAEAGAVTLEEVGLIMNVTRERVRQLETIGLATMRQHRTVAEIADVDAPAPDEQTEAAA